VIIGVIALTLASVLFGQTDTGRGAGAPPGSTYQTDGDGLSAIYTVLAEEELAIRWERQPHRLRSEVDKFVLWQPDEVADADWNSLLDWVGEGHTLMIAGASHLPGSVAEGGSIRAVSASAHPATVGVEAVSVGGGSFQTLDQPALVHLVAPDGRPVVASWAHGQGRIYWSADGEWLANGRIDQASNLTLAMNLLVPAPGKVTAFDEYHHGFGAAERWYQLLRGPLQGFLIQLSIALIALYWAYGVRFGAPRPLPPVPPRAAVEYVYSMSQLYRRAGARSLAAQALYRSLTRELSRLLGGLGSLPHGEIARRVAERTGLPAEQIASVLDRTGPQAARTPTDKELILLSREVEAIQRSVHNAGFRDQRHPGTGAQ
jgi:hypothetical protein